MRRPLTAFWSATCSSGLTWTAPQPSRPQSLRRTCPFSNFDVRYQTEQRAAPIRPPPCVRPVEPLIPRLGQPLPHVANHIAPHLLRLQPPDLRSRDRLDICRASFFDPVMLLGHRRKPPVDHLMRHHPVCFQIVRGAVLPHGNAAMRSPFAEASPIGNPAAAPPLYDLNQPFWNRKLPVVGTHRPRRQRHPLHHRIAR